MFKTYPLIIFAFLATVVCAWAAPQPLWVNQRTGDACMTLASMPDQNGDRLGEVLAGYDSGALVCWNGEATSPSISLWSVETTGTVLALLPVPAPEKEEPPRVVVSNDLGNIFCINADAADAGDLFWSFRSSCAIAALTLFADITGDGYPEILAGGAEQFLYLLDGLTGNPVWSCNLTVHGGYSYIHRFFETPDINKNETPDIVLLDWNGNVFTLDGGNGSVIWNKSVTGGFTEALALMDDITGDGLPDIIAGGNSKHVRLLSGVNGDVIWTCALGRPVRAVCVPGDLNGDGKPDCFAAMAGGRVAAISGAGSGSVTPLWTANVGDTCRILVSPGDINVDGIPDAVVCAENGVVEAFSGNSGAEIWRWTGPDVMRCLIIMDDADGDNMPDLAAGALDGTLALLPGRFPENGGALHAGFFGTKAAPVKPQPSQVRFDPASFDPAVSAVADNVPILLYHDVVPIINYYYGVSVENFRAQMDILVEGGFTCVSLDQIADWIEGKIELPERSICITFDGPYEGHHTHAYPILKERGLFAESYITTDWIGTVNHADWHQLREMDADGIEDIQNHSANHPGLASVSRDEVIFQITDCNRAIQAHMGGKISLHHAYPGGSYSSTVIGILRELGERTATTVVNRAAIRTDQLLALPRLSVVKNTSILSFRALIGYTDPPPPALPYVFDGTVGTGWSQPSYAEVDASGRLWVCQYIPANVRVFNPDGTEASFSPITHGQTPAGASKEMSAVSGIVATPGGEMIVTIANYTSNPTYFALFRFRASDGQALPGKELTWRPGDAACDAAGRIFIVDKVIDKWHVFSPDLQELPGSPMGPAGTDNIQRGIAVLPDASKVYVICETEGTVKVWEGGIGGEGVAYTRKSDLVQGLGGASGGVDVMRDGTVLVSDEGRNLVLAYDADHKLIGSLSGGYPAMSLPRGTAFLPDGSVIWVICRSGLVQRWVLPGAPSGMVLY